MKRWQRVLAYTFVVLLVVLAGGISATVGWRPVLGPRARPLTDRTFTPSPERLARGAYLLSAVTPCLACHSESVEPGAMWVPKPGTEGGGQPWPEPALSWVVTPNITPDRDTGIGGWSDDAIARAVREGIGHDGRALFPLMPYQKFRRMSDEDLASVVTYLRTLSPLRRERPRSAIPFPVNRLINAAPEPLDAPVPEPDRSTPEKRGAYLVNLAVCADCHTPVDANNQPIAGMDLAGGNTVELPGRPIVAAANLTPAPNGIPYYTEEIFAGALRTGHVGARELSEVMPWRFFRHMTDEDLASIFAYLETLPPVDHYVDNALAPTMCARCGHVHGGGERNKKPA
ncbi:MAG: cytochrome c [Acidobacteria bacterium]|nr:cytochrome c [Acidobacteriota bacterium]